LFVGGQASVEVQCTFYLLNLYRGGRADAK
jgi:hypothetical protein